MNSLWKKESEKPEFFSLSGEIKTEVLIIGGGIAGILCADSLRKAGIDYLLVEADEIGRGITQNTTAKITFQHGLIYSKLIKKYGEEKAGIYYQANKNALDEFLSASKNIECDFEITDNFVYSTDCIGKVEDELAALNKLGIEAEFRKELNLPFNVAGAVMIKNQAQFNPLKFIYALAKELNIFEKTKVTGYKDNCILINNGIIKANKIIVATHFPIFNKHGLFFMKMYQQRSYVCAYDNAPKLEGMYVDEKDNGMSFRNYKDLLLIGGGGHRTGKNGGNWQEIRSFAQIKYPDAREKFWWATQDCITLDGMPYIGQYSPSTPELFVATGFNKWGMTSSMVAAKLITDLILGKSNPAANLFDPSRSILQPKLAVNSVETILNLITPTKPRCPHLGCALKYNKAEHSWDCPCHGSRFDENGKLIDNPAADDIDLN